MPARSSSRSWWLLYALRLTSNFYRDWPGLQKEDFRYVSFRERFGKAYWPVSFLGIHLFPTIMVYLGCLPLYAVTRTGSRRPGLARRAGHGRDPRCCRPCLHRRRADAQVSKRPRAIEAEWWRAGCGRSAVTPTIWVRWPPGGACGCSPWRRAPVVVDRGRRAGDHRHVRLCEHPHDGAADAGHAPRLRGLPGEDAQVLPPPDTLNRESPVAPPH